MNNFKSFRVSLALIFSIIFAGESLADNCTYRIDLNKVDNDRLLVEMITPPVGSESIEFQMPKIVPGTYSISDFGRFVSGVKAFDKDGNELKVDEIDENRWKINSANQLNRITYWVDDTWDSGMKPSIFEPGGTNIEAGTNFMINTFGFFGYLEGKKNVPITLEVTKPEGFYGSTALIAKSTSAQKDIYEIKDYHLFADSPLMYCKPDTSIRNVGGADVLISVYSPNQKVSANAIMKEISEILSAQKEYLGGKLPVEKYAFLIYLTDDVGGSGGMGALEHSYSSMYYMPETEESAAAKMMVDVAAHEFFHIVTPLSIHSEEIGNFDFINPKMSKHLWMYEGVTEYSAGHVQVKYGLITPGEYFRILRSKMTFASAFLDTVPFTEISAGCLDQYKSQYLNVYQKGALIGMSLDILLLDLTDGKMGIQKLMRELAKTYGKDHSFIDDELFDKITELSSPEIRDFFRKYVEGPNPLPFEDIFKRAGIIYQHSANDKVPSTGRINFGMNRETGRIVVESTKRADKFGEALKLVEGDELVKFDGVEINTQNMEEVFANFRKNRKEGDKVVVEYMRKDGSGTYQAKTAKAKVVLSNWKGMHMLSFDPDATEKQKMVRTAWLTAEK